MKPFFSQTSSFSLLRRPLMNAKSAPDMGSCWMTSFARMARPSICFLISAMKGLVEQIERVIIHSEAIL
jgi:hypothetical protein